ncbi:MAG: LysE family translocator [Flavobacteriales bacterium]
MALFHGYLLGLGFVIFLGPVFFYLLKCTLDGGFLSGLSVALGIIFGDFLCIVICSLGAIAFFEDASNQFWIGIVGGIILLILGLKFIFNPKINTETENKVRVKLSKANYAAYFTQGFLINFINPFVFVVWISVIGVAKSEYPDTNDLFMFLGAALLGIFSTDLLKVLTAHRIKKFLSPKHLINIYRVFGVILLVFGIWAIVYCFK